MLIAFICISLLQFSLFQLDFVLTVFKFGSVKFVSVQFRWLINGSTLLFVLTVSIVQRSSSKDLQLNVRFPVTQTGSSGSSVWQIFLYSKAVGCCCWLPEPFWGMWAWRETIEPQKPGNSPGSGPEVVKRQRVAKE